MQPMHTSFLAAVALSFAAQAAPELGVYRWDAPTGPANIDNFSVWLGQPVSIATAFEPRATWDDIDGSAWQLAPWSQWVRAQPGRNLSLAIPMLPASGASLAGCGAGQYDVYWRNLANELAVYGLHWAYLRLGWEMDGSWYAWTAAPGSGREASYAACFRRVVQVMRQAQPANQWKFVLNVTANWRSRAYLDAIWPGDAYVDVLAMDLYDQSWAANTYPYPATCDAACRLARQQGAWADYSAILYTLRDFALAHGKPLALPEWGVALRPDGHGGGDNPYFIRNLYEFIREPANNVAYHSYWDVSAGDIDGRLTDSVTGDSPSGATRFPQSAALFKQLFGPAAPTPPAPPPVAGPTGVMFLAPAANAMLSGAFRSSSLCEVSGTGIRRVVFFLDQKKLNTDTAAPWNCTINTRHFANGPHTLRAVAYDSAGASTTIERAVHILNP